LRVSDALLRETEALLRENEAPNRDSAFHLRRNAEQSAFHKDAGILPG